MSGGLVAVGGGSIRLLLEGGSRMWQSSGILRVGHLSGDKTLSTERHVVLQGWFQAFNPVLEEGCTSEQQAQRPASRCETTYQDLNVCFSSCLSITLSIADS